MLSELISSKTRLKLLFKFYLNAETKSYLRNLERELNESTNAIRIELKKLELLNLIKCSVEGNKKLYQVNTSHDLFCDIRKLILKDVGLFDIKTVIKEDDQSIKSIYVLGDYANGLASQIIDIAIISDKLDMAKLNRNISSFEATSEKRIRYIVVSQLHEKTFLRSLNYFTL